jgi:hypothetical protein
MTERQYEVGAQEKYELDKEDYETINDAAEWFLGTRKPRTSSEVRGILVRLYLKGMTRGIRLTKELIEEEVDRRWDS